MIRRVMRLVAYTSLMAVSMGWGCGLSDLSSGLCPAPSSGRSLRYVLYSGVVGKGQHGGRGFLDSALLEVTRGGGLRLKV